MGANCDDFHSNFCNGLQHNILMCWIPYQHWFGGKGGFEWCSGHFHQYFWWGLSGLFCTANCDLILQPCRKKLVSGNEMWVKSIIVLRIYVLNTNCFVAYLLNSVEWNGKVIFDTVGLGVPGEECNVRYSE